MAGRPMTLCGELIDAVGDIYYYARGLNQCVRMLQGFYRVESPEGEVVHMPEDEVKELVLKKQNVINGKTKIAETIEHINNISITNAIYGLTQLGYKVSPQVHKITKTMFGEWIAKGEEVRAAIQADEKFQPTENNLLCLRFLETVESAKSRLISENQRILKRNKACEKNIGAVIQELKWLDKEEFGDTQQVEHNFNGSIEINGSLFDLIRTMKEQGNQLPPGVSGLIEDKSDIIDVQYEIGDLE